MKTMLLILACVSHLVLEAQITIGFKFGFSPDVNPKTAHCIVNRSDPDNELLFNSTHVKYTPAAGALLRLDRKPFWISAEVLAYGSTETYAVQYMNERHPAGSVYFKEKSYIVEVPISVGVSLGKLEIFSGFSPSQTLSVRSELDQIDGYTSQLSKRRMGWHTGIGINLHNVLVDLRYTQSFANYGQHRFVNGQELTLGNAPARIVATITYRF